MSTQNILELKNLGPKSQQWLNAIGVYTRHDLKLMGAIDCYTILKAQGYPVSLNLVYAIEAALLDIHWTKLPGKTKQALQDALKEP